MAYEACLVFRRQALSLIDDREQLVELHVARSHTLPVNTDDRLSLAVRVEHDPRARMLLNGRGELTTEHELRIETFDLGIEVIRRDTDHLVVGTKCLKGGRDYLSIGPRLVGEQSSRASPVVSPCHPPLRE